MSKLEPAPDTIKTRTRTFDAVLQISVEHPMLTPLQIAALLKRDERVVVNLMRSDAFLELRARGILERYGSQIEGVRGKVLDVAADVLDALKARISNPEAEIPVATLIEAGKFIMQFVMAPVGQAEGIPGSAANNITINISPEDMQRARDLQSRRANAIEVRPPVIALTSRSGSNGGGQ